MKQIEFNKPFEIVEECPQCQNKLSIWEDEVKTIALIKCDECQYQLTLCAHNAVYYPYRVWLYNKKVSIELLSTLPITYNKLYIIIYDSSNNCNGIHNHLMFEYCNETPNWQELMDEIDKYLLLM